MSADPEARPKRPRYLVFSLVLVWVVGLFGSANGCQATHILWRPTEFRQTTTADLDAASAKRFDVLIDALVAHRAVNAPLAAGELVLGTLLMLTASFALVGRGRARGLLVQACLAYAAFLPIDYALHRPVRAAQIEQVLLDAKLAPGMDHAAVAEQLRPYLWAAARVALALQLAAVVMGAIALTRPRVRAYYAWLNPDDGPKQAP